MTSLIPNDSRRQNELEDDGNYYVWLAPGWGINRAVPATQAHRTLMDHMSIHRLRGEASGLYLEWNFSDLGTSKVSFSQFFTELGVDSSVRLFLQSHSGFRDRLRSVYAEATGGKPYGKYIAQLGSETRRLQGLFVQMFGHRNAMPCNHCEERYLHTFVTLSEDPRKAPKDTIVPARGNSKSTVVHVMVPWFECVSLPGFHNNACGNCLFFVEGHLCSFHSDRPYSQALDRFRASARVSMELGDRKLSPEMSPRASGDLLGLVDDAAVRDWQIATVKRLKDDAAAARASKKAAAQQKRDMGSG